MSVWGNIGLVTTIMVYALSPDGRFMGHDGLDVREIFVINVCGYIGESICNKIAYAKSQGIAVRYLENI